MWEERVCIYGTPEEFNKFPLCIDVSQKKKKKKTLRCIDCDANCGSHSVRDFDHCPWKNCSISI